MDRPEVHADLAAVRARELDASLAALGVTDSVRFGYPDSGHVPGFDGITELDPDHTRTHLLTVAAYDVAADPQRFPDAGAPWAVAKLYYTAVSNPARSAAIDAASRARGLDSPFTGCADDDRDDPSTTFVEVAGFLAAREQALRAHASQIDPDGPWLSVPTKMLSEVYPYEAFALARASYCQMLWMGWSAMFRRRTLGRCLDRVRGSFLVAVHRCCSVRDLPICSSTPATTSSPRRLTL